MKLYPTAGGRVIGRPRPELTVRELITYERATHPRRQELPPIHNPEQRRSTVHAATGRAL